MTNHPPSGTYTLRPRARLISLLGQELISDEPVAVVELVKNAYDADATRVEVRFEGNGSAPDRLVVEDDGIGMDLETVLGAWLEPGTTSKREKRQSAKGRVYQGEKGIGRFAAARLAKTLLLESRQLGAESGVVVLLDWDLFDDTKYLADVPIEYETRPLPNLHGTRLSMEGLRKPWSEEDFKALQYRLSRLISPFAEVGDFSIVLNVPGVPESGPVQPPELILEPRYLLKGNVGANGLFTGTMLHAGKQHETYKDRQLLPKGRVPGCGPFEVEIRAWDRDREGLDPITAKTGLGVQEIRRTLNAYCGVSIYRDGFRVYPYGQTGNDWLTLDNRSRQNPVKNLANNQIVAAIRISRDTNPQLVDRSNREGMVLNAEHAELEAWFRAVLSVLEEERYPLRPREKDVPTADPLFEGFDLKPAVDVARRELGAEHIVARMIETADQQVRAGVDRVQSVFSRLLLSSGLGHMVDIVIHEIGAPLGKVNRQLATLEKTLRAKLDEEALAKVEPMLSSLKGWLEQIHSLRQRLEPQTPAKRGRATSFDVREEIEDTLALYSSVIAKQGVSVKPDLPKQALQVKMSRAALGQVLANLVDNSLFWITHDKGLGAGGQLHVAARRLPHGFSVTVSDDGPGVAEADLPLIFDPYFTRKPSGMGLGLYIARLVIEPYGKLVYRDDGPLPGAGFEARFEKGVGL